MAAAELSGEPPGRARGGMPAARGENPRTREVRLVATGGETLLAIGTSAPISGVPDIGPS